jgi:hypothetical protein
VARTIINWNNGFDACLKPTPGASGSSGTSQISHYGSDTIPIDVITAENQRFKGYNSYKVTIKPPQSARARSYASLDVPNIPSDGQNFQKYYFHSVYLGDVNNSRDFGHISSGEKNANFGTALAGFRYHDGGHNGPRGWLGLAPSGYPMMGGGGTIANDTPGSYLSGSTLPDGPYFVRGRWVDSVILVNWGARGTNYAARAFAEFWIKFADQQWSQGVHGKTTLGVPTEYWARSSFSSDLGASSYHWVGMYTGNGYFSLGDPSVTTYHGPWVMADSFVEADLATELEGGTDPVLPSKPSGIKAVMGVY